MNQNIPWEQLAKYFAEELSEEESEKMESWITADPERRKKVQALRRVWNEAGHSARPLNVDEAWQTLSGNMDELDQMPIREAQEVLSGSQPQRQYEYKETGTGKSRDHQYGHQKFRRWMMTAAAAVVLLVAGLFTYQQYDPTPTKTVEIGSRELVAQNGERATYVLNDGSRIILHAGSRLEVPLSFNADSRELFLEGEAYFEVTHDASKPFSVHTNNGYTRVLGTKFIVQAWADTPSNMEVIVEEGKVALGDNQNIQQSKDGEAIITKNQKGILSGTNGPEVVQQVDMDWYLGWTKGQLKFNNRPFSEIIPRLERWYAIDIQTENKDIGNKRLTAEIDYSQPMEEVLQGIALSIDLEYEKTGQTVTFY